MTERRACLTAAAGMLAAGALMAACNRGTGGNGDSARNSAAQKASAKDCSAVPDAAALTKFVRAAPDSGEAGGLFGGRAEWAAVVNRAGKVCAIVIGKDSVGGRWPGSKNIARAKAFTANGFSTDTLALSTARLYTLVQPGHSLQP